MITTRTRRDGVTLRVRSGSDHPNWKGGSTRKADGYRVISENGVWQLEHRAVMSGILGRPLSPDEHVHHRNGDPSDNRPENLELLTASEHARTHARAGERRKVVERTCALCSTPFYPATGYNGSQQKCCSLKCGIKWAWQNGHARKAQQREMVCGNCGVHFMRAPSRPVPKTPYCSIACRDARRHPQ